MEWEQPHKEARMPQLEIFGQVLLQASGKPLAEADITLYDLDDPLSDTNTPGHTGEVILKTRSDAAGFFRGQTTDWDDSRHTFHKPGRSGPEPSTIKLVDKLILLVRIEKAGRSLLATYHLPKRLAGRKRRSLSASGEQDWDFQPILVPWEE
jgi:hypothetical protein